MNRPRFGKLELAKSPTTKHNKPTVWSSQNPPRWGQRRSNFENQLFYWRLSAPTWYFSWMTSHSILQTPQMVQCCRVWFISNIGCVGSKVGRIIDDIGQLGPDAKAYGHLYFCTLNSSTPPTSPISPRHMVASTISLAPMSKG